MLEVAFFFIFFFKAGVGLTAVTSGMITFSTCTLGAPPRSDGCGR